jgi:hypothetical protein
MHGAGTVWTASAHIITAVIGSGVLSLAWAMAQLGWVAGPVILLLFAAITYYTSCLLTDCYRFGDPATGKRNYTYTEAVESYLGTSTCYLRLQIHQKIDENNECLACMLCRRQVCLVLRLLPVRQHVRHRHRLHHHGFCQRCVRRRLPSSSTNDSCSG